MSVRISLLSLAVLLGSSSAVLAQRPVFRRTADEDKRSTVGFSARMLFGVNMDLSNLGTVTYPTLDDEDHVEGQAEYLFSDGQLIIDTITDAEGNVVPVDATSRFAFLYDNATIITDPTSFNSDQMVITDFSLSRYSSVSTGAVGAADDATNYGWEITYGYQFGKPDHRMRFGFMGGFAVNNLDFRYADTVYGEAWKQTFTFTPTSPIYIGDNADLTGSWNSAEDGGPEIDFTNPSNLIDFDAPDERYYQWIDGEYTAVDSEVAAAFDYDGILAMVRVGPTVSMRVIDNLNVELSAGIVGVYLSSRITLSQTIVNLPTTSIDPEDTFTETRDDFLIGFFGEGSLRYQVTPRVGLYSSLMYMKVQDLKNTTIGDVDFDLSLQSPMFATAGLRLTF